MQITHYLYNTFLIEHGELRVAVDPGGELFLFRFGSLLPQSVWPGVSHILVTHGDPDHHWHTDRVAKASQAEVICGTDMVQGTNGDRRMLGPRDRGLAFTTAIDRLHTLAVGETKEVAGLRVTGLKATHGPLTFQLGPFKKRMQPGPAERIGRGAMGFLMELGGKTLVNLGDTMLQQTEWQQISRPDVLMIPIGGRIAGNTMDEKEALTAVERMQPRLVIPCHYNCDSFLSRAANAADDLMFQSEVKKMGLDCQIMHKGEALVL